MSCQQLDKLTEEQIPRVVLGSRFVRSWICSGCFSSSCSTCRRSVCIYLSCLYSDTSCCVMTKGQSHLTCVTANFNRTTCLNLPFFSPSYLISSCHPWLLSHSIFHAVFLLISFCPPHLCFSCFISISDISALPPSHRLALFQTLRCSYLIRSPSSCTWHRCSLCCPKTWPWSLSEKWRHCRANTKGSLRTRVRA